MAEQPRKKLTKAEAGRLGGLKTKQRHGSEHFRRAGALGAKAVMERHGIEHYRRIGKAGFLALAKRIGLWNAHDSDSGRARAIRFLNERGRMKPRWKQYTEEELAAMDAWVDATFEAKYRAAHPEEDPEGGTTP
jgi:hypothetical protein